MIYISSCQNTDLIPHVSKGSLQYKILNSHLLVETGYNPFQPPVKMCTSCPLTQSCKRPTSTHSIDMLVMGGITPFRDLFLLLLIVMHIGSRKHLHDNPSQPPAVVPLK